ncbi:hypothetical protein DH2020_022695 [Rehmannia glutinosa]|uniref:Exostosin GT47 domain-containing protein n=1 Tax=Rehmannia glutinosa TaxID=99300 RepID=A0ABR0W7T0_REHGL
MPIFHNGPCMSIYSTEGNFIYEMEKGSFYRTNDPTKAHVFFLRFSVVVMVQYFYEARSKDRMPLLTLLLIIYRSTKHPFWNLSLGDDHFMISCHDWSPYQIRINQPQDRGNHGTPWWLSSSILAFFAGQLHDRIRHHLLKHWKEKDPDVQVYDELPGNVSYESMLRNSGFCLCPSGYEVASPRVVEAIYAECVPVLILDGYVPPFNDVLIWEEFCLVIDVENIVSIKEILMGIS